MSYTPISINREALTIMDVPFPSLEAWESAAAAIGSNMFGGGRDKKTFLKLWNRLSKWKVEMFCSDE